MTHSYRAVLFTITLSVFVSVSSVPSFALTGDVDPTNKTPECISLASNIRYGDSDSVSKGPITKLQTFLIDEGYMKGEATGYFGAVTFASIKRYQVAKGLTDSGYVGEYTRAAVKADTCSEVTKPAAVTKPQTTSGAAVFGPTSSSSSTSATTGGATFGAGYGSQPVTYGWVAYAGSMLGAQSPENLGWSSPSTPCTASNAGASYYLGVSSSGSQVVATCAASNQAVTDFAPVTSSTLNTQGQTSSGNSQSQTTGGAVFGGSATVTCTESRGTFTNSVGQLIEWSCGCANPPAGGAWVSVGGSCFHQVIQ